MQADRFRIGGVLFLIAGAAFIFVAVLGQRAVFFILGCAFMALGGAFLATSRRTI